MVTRLIESEKIGTFANATLLTADDGTTAVEQLRNEMSAGRPVHFVLMDFIMVSIDDDDDGDGGAYVCFTVYLDYHGRPRGSPHDERRAQLPRSHSRYAAHNCVMYVCM